MGQIEKNLAEKLKEYIDEKLNSTSFYEWGMEQLYENKEDEADSENKELVKDLFGDIAEFREPEWSTWTKEKAQYYFDCLIGKEKYSLERANQLGKKLDI